MKVTRITQSLFSAMDFIAKCVCAVCAFGFFCIIVWQVISRFFFNATMNWTDEACRYLFYIMVFAGSVLCVNENGHFSIDICTTLLPEKAKKIVSILVYIISIVFLVYLTQSGLHLSSQTVGQHSNVLGIPTDKLYLVMPISSALMILYTLRVAIEDLFADKLGLRKEEEVL